MREGVCCKIRFNIEKCERGQLMCYFFDSHPPEDAQICRDVAPHMSQMTLQTCLRHALDDAPDIPQMMPQTCLLVI